MVEHTLQRRLKRAATLVLGVCVLLTICGGFLYAYLQSSRNEMLRSQVAAETDEYKTRILKQLKGNFQMLSSLSELMKDGDTFSDAEIAKRLSAIQSHTNYVNLVYYRQDFSGVISSLDGNTVTDAHISELSYDGQQSVKEALSGQPHISRLFDSVVSNSRVFVLSVPVYNGNRVIGALSASSHIDVFSDIISGDTVLGGGGYLHMIDSDGNFLIRSTKKVVKEDYPNIWKGHYLLDDETEKIRTALKNEKQVYSVLSYEGKNYTFMIEPVGINGWYLFCVNANEGISEGYSSTLLTTQIIFAVIIFLVVALMIYGYRLLRNYNKELVVIAYRDPLTGGENLVRFRQRLRQALEDSQGSVTALTIRQFPFLTEIFGKETSDELLCIIKAIIEKHMKNNEFFCHDTDDKFYLFFLETDKDTVRSRLEEIIKEIENNPIERLKDYQLAVYCGVIFSDSSESPVKSAENMLSKVQFALDTSKGSHSSKIWFFDVELHKREELENYIESHMSNALQTGEFALFLQPKTDLQSGKLSGAEALVRWKTSTGRMIFPDQFIPLFEKNGFCARLDLYMVEIACKTIRSWIDSGKTPVPISVNQTKLLFFDGEYVTKLTSILEKYGVSPKLITLEILEGLALEDVGRLNDIISSLQAEGFKISLDDFGSGYSSLNTLGKLKIDELKLDRGFLLSAAEEKEGRVRLIMEEIVRMANRLGIKTVSEGVETAEDVTFVKTIGCTTGQGYYYSKPISVDEFTQKYIQ